MRKLSKKLYLLSVCAILVCVFSTVLGCSGDPTPEPEVVNYTVTFDLCTELQTTKVLPQTVVAGSRIDEPQVFIIGDNSDNWEIDGWYREKTYESKWDFYFDEVDSNITLYAKWKSDPQYTVQFFAGDAAEPTYSTKVKKGLQAAECDDRFNGYEVLGYFTSPDFETEFDFDMPITESTNIYVKLSDYLYFTPKYLSTFAGHNASSVLASDESVVEISYSETDNYIYAKDLNLVLNGHELIEVVYKLEGASRVDLYWYASNIDGTPVDGQTDFNARTRNVGLEEHYTDISIDQEGWTHAIYDLTRPRAYKDGILSAPLSDIGTLNGFRIDVDGETENPVKLTIKYVKAQKKSVSEGYTVRYHADGREAYSEEVSAGQTATAPRDEQILVGRQILGYYTTEDYKTEFNFETPINSETDIYVKLSDYLYFNGAMLDTFAILNGATKTLNTDGTLTFAGPNGAILNKSDLNLALNGKTTLEIKAKTDMKLGGAWALFFNGDQRLTYSAGDTDSDGWTTFTAELGEIETLTQLRFDIYGSAPDSSIQFDYIKVI